MVTSSLFSSGVVTGHAASGVASCARLAAAPGMTSSELTRNANTTSRNNRIMRPPRGELREISRLSILHASLVPEHLDLVECPMTDLEDRLFQLLQLVNDWLKFGETKSGGMVVLAGLAATGLLTYGSDIAHPTPWDGWTLFLAGFFFTLSLSIAVWSFLPRRDAPKIASRL